MSHKKWETKALSQEAVRSLIDYSEGYLLALDDVQRELNNSDNLLTIMRLREEVRETLRVLKGLSHAETPS